MAKTKDLDVDLRKKMVEQHAKDIGYKKTSQNLCVNQNSAASIVQKF